MENLYTITYLPSLATYASVQAQRDAIDCYMNIIRTYQHPATRLTVSRHPVALVLISCGSLASKGGLKFNGEEVIYTTIEIAWQLGLPRTIEAEHAETFIQ